MTLSPLDIQQQQFKVRFRGFDIETQIRAILVSHGKLLEVETAKMDTADGAEAKLTYLNNAT
jgi:hypothetical protein